MDYVYFTDEQKQRANSVDLVDFLERQGEKLVRSGHEWRWKRYDSVTVRGNEWFRHSRKEGGHAIDFVQEFYDMSFPEAVQWLLGGESGVEWNQTGKNAPTPEKEFALPDANPDMRRVFAYLIKQRFIDREVLSRFAHAKLIYEDKQYHNAVFVGLDENGIARHAHKRGTYTQGEPYKGNTEGSDPRYSFHWIGKSDRLYVFEAPVDMLSFITLHPKDWMNHSYVTLDGVSEHAMLRQLELHPNLKKVILCLDHDEAGIEATGRLRGILAERGYMDTEVLQSVWKDWNEDVKALHGVTPIPASEHPKLELLPKVCEGISSLCEALSTQRDLRAFLADCARELEPLTASGKVTSENTGMAVDSLECMAAGSLLLLKDLCRQMERPVTAEQLVRKLQSEYKPHEDRGWLRSRMENIRRDFADIGKQVDTPGIRSEDDMRQLCRSYLNFALDCVKARMFVELESPELIPEQEQAVNFTMSM
ncbi:DUF3991 domain-containing protein [Oscillibacter sp.]|jgi:hypothetical protein|uniref:DUF3991 domain-containing protein n=1 Tax=Oscillibacter sp. TaxID=1945593 RepID=UPI0033980533